jgi:hypothetical protein
VEELIEEKIRLKKSVENYDEKNQFLNKIIVEKVVQVSFDCYFIQMAINYIAANSNSLEASNILSAITYSLQDQEEDKFIKITPHEARFLIN